MAKFRMNKVIGFAPNNSMASINGLDDIDRWAAHMGESRKKMKEMTTVAKGKKKLPTAKL